MDSLHHLVITTLLAFCLAGCSQSNSNDGQTSPPQNELSILKVKFHDTDPEIAAVSGDLHIDLNSSYAKNSDSNSSDLSNTSYQIQIDLIDNKQQTITENWYRNEFNTDKTFIIPSKKGFESNTFGFKVSLIENQTVIDSYPLHVLDFTGNSHMTGTGGGYNNKWEYGKQRSAINIRRDHDHNLCYLDNGLVQVIDMNDQKDLRNSEVHGKPTDDNLFPAYSFSCSDTPHNTERAILIDESLEATDENIWTYSVLNDAMHYGNRTYHHLYNILGVSPLEDKLRIRVHYGTPFVPFINWDGSYANFTEGYPDVHPSPVTLDILAHEIGHGVLNRLTPSFNDFKRNYSIDIKTTHEAFSDITGFVVKYKETQQKLWTHGEDAQLAMRELNKIVTEEGAVQSYLDYKDAGKNPYLGIGLLTYPFYLISEKVGIEETYALFVHAAEHCWQDDHSLPDIAACIKSSSDSLNLPSEEVIKAFKTVKIKLFDEGILSHYKYEKFKLNVEFEDNSQSTNQTTEWHWDFGDGQTSTEENPIHTYNSKGSYQVTLSVKDNSSDTDTFTRSIDVTDKYCAPISSNINRAQIASVNFNGDDLNFNSNNDSYTYNASNISNASTVSLDISGNMNTESNTITWSVWLDKNNNGIYENHELIKTEESSDTSNYSWLTSLDLSDIDLSSTQYLRIAGKHLSGFPCSTYKGQMIDLKLQ